MSAQFHKVAPRIWREKWSDDTRYVALYILTCEHRNTEGIFYMPLEYAITDLKWSPKRFKGAFHELQRHGFIFYDQDTSVCLIAKALKMNGRANPNQIKHVAATLRELPPTPLRNHFLTLTETLAPTLSEGLRKAFPEGFPNGSVEGLANPSSPSRTRTSSCSSEVAAVPESNLTTKRMSKVA